MTTPPLFVFQRDSGDLDVFDELDRAAAHIEVFDIDNVEVFASDGQALRAVAEGHRTRLVEFGSPDRDALAARLRAYANQRSISIPDYADIITALGSRLD